tara:strand:+ start:21287 stop:21817 length:531 start_codon:yes stop_codon:yes gene_type:complete
MYLKSLKGCRLAIGSYPFFDYDATGGGGEISLPTSSKINLQYIRFEPETFSIPPLTFKTTKFLSFPLPPGLSIEMYMDKLEGTINKKSGEVLLNLEAKFIFRIGTIFTFPKLLVNTLLRTGSIQTNLYKEEGIALQDDGSATLIGVAIIPITGNKILDLFLGLPNEALAILKCKIK